MSSEDFQDLIGEISRLQIVDKKVLNQFLFDKKQIAEIALALKSNIALKTLEIGLDSTYASIFFPQILENRTLSTLGLNGYFRDFCPDDLDHIVRGLTNNSTLKVLWFMNVKIEGKLHALLQTIKKNNSLQKLHLFSTSLFGEDLKYLAELLETNTSLESLVVSDSQNFCSKNFEIFCAVLEKNMTLKRLGLHGVGISTAGAKKLALALIQNKSLTSITLERNMISLAALQAFSEALNNNHSMLYLGFGRGISADPEERRIMESITSCLERNKKVSDASKIADVPVMCAVSISPSVSCSSSIDAVLSTQSPAVLLLPKFQKVRDESKSERGSKDEQDAKNVRELSTILERAMTMSQTLSSLEGLDHAGLQKHLEQAQLILKKVVSFEPSKEKI